MQKGPDDSKMLEAVASTVWDTIRLNNSQESVFSEIENAVRRLQKRPMDVKRYWIEERKHHEGFFYKKETNVSPFIKKNSPEVQETP